MVETTTSPDDNFRRNNDRTMAVTSVLHETTSDESSLSLPSVEHDGRNKAEEQSRMKTTTGITVYNNDTMYDTNITSRKIHDITAPIQKSTNFRTTKRNQRCVSLVLGMVVIICLGVGIYFFMESKGISLSKNTKSTSSKSQNSIIVMEELLLHNDPITDCWLSIHDTIYDLTDYALVHPGGPEFITDYCGTNATKAYDIEHPTELLALLSSDTIMGTLQEQDATMNDLNTTTTSNKEIDDEQSIPTVAPIKIVKTEAPQKEVVEDNDDGNDDNNDDTISTPTEETSTMIPTSAPLPSCISSVDVSLHATRDDCWYILYGQVYDFTDYIDLHPGGARYVFQECGTDATFTYSNERFHDQALLQSEGANDWYLLGSAC